MTARDRKRNVWIISIAAAVVTAMVALGALVAFVATTEPSSSPPRTVHETPRTSPDHDSAPEPTIAPDDRDDPGRGTGHDIDHRPVAPELLNGALPDVEAAVAVERWLEDGGRVPESTTAEPSGSFRMFCWFSHLAYDDPIVYPGEVGVSHLHAYFGNTSADAASTYTSLRTTGDSTCQGGPLNRTGYWVPALFDDVGDVVVPEFFELYYKGNGTEEMIRSIETNPNGLRMIAGYDPVAHRPEPDAPAPAWTCESSDESATIPDCPTGQLVEVGQRFPMCWNGRDLDAPNHRSHMAYGTGGDGWVTKERGCPASHPVHLPELTLIAAYRSDGNSSKWYLSSDRMPGMTHANGTTFHADWFGAWDNQTQETWTQKCIREMRTCVYGELGDGTALVHPGEYDGPRRLEPPAR